MPEVIIYTAPNCPSCFAAKKFLTAKGIPFQEVSNRSDLSAYPVISISGNYFTGWSHRIQQEIERILERSFLK